MLLLVKLVAMPALVWLTSWINRRYGGIAAGMLAGLPLVTGPVAFFMAIEQGPRFGAQSATAILHALAGVTLFAVAYALAARRFGWPVCVAAGIAVYFAVAATSVGVESGPWVAGAVVLVLVAAGLSIVREPAAAALHMPPPWWDIWLRMALALAIVLAVTALAEALGPRFSAIPATFPAISSVIIPFTHARGGPGAATRLVRGVILSHIAFVLMFLVVALAIEAIGAPAAYALALAAGLAASALVFGLAARWRRAGD
jgi:hypothetical protein